MRALVSVSGGSARLENHWPDPTPPPDGAVVRVRRAGIDFGDIEVAKGYRSYAGPLGNAFVGDVVDAAPGHEAWLGARVVGDINFGCGGPSCAEVGEQYCSHRFVLGIAPLACPFSHGDRRVGGAFAELLALPARNLHRVPDSVGDRSALFCEPLAAAVQILEQVHVRPTARIGVFGDGPLAFGIAQVMRWPGAEVKVLGSSKTRLQYFADLGFQIQDLSQESTETFDIVVDCGGSPDGPARAMRHVIPNGTVILKSTIRGLSELDVSAAVVDQIRLIGSRSGPIAPVIRALADQRLAVEQFITHTFELADATAALEQAAHPDSGKVEIIMGSADAQ